MQNEDSRLEDVEDEDSGAISKNRFEGQKKDRSLEQFRRWHETGRLIFPKWQRHYVWNNKDASLLIESFLIDMPVPVVYLAHNDENKYEVIDGQQRLISVIRFFKNKYKLTGLEIRADLKGCEFRGLPADLQEKLYDSTLSSVEFPAETPKTLTFSMFERLNTTGKPLVAQEIRNCIYQGKLNDLIVCLASKTEEFTKCMNQKGLVKRMKDCEYVLRFLAFYQLKYQKARKGMKAFLNEFCEAYQNAPDKKLEEYENQFKKAIKAAFTIWGDRAFRLNLIDPKNANAAAYQVIIVSFTEYDLIQLTSSADSIYEEYVDLLLTDAQWVESVSNHTADYNRMKYAFETWTDRLREATKGSEPNDSRRCFSRALKEDMYRQNNQVCEICEQKIAHIYDAVLDHDTHYWRGGKTVPENARLVHRICNATRPNNECA